MALKQAKTGIAKAFGIRRAPGFDIRRPSNDPTGRPRPTQKRQNGMKNLTENTQSPGNPKKTENPGNPENARRPQRNGAPRQGGEFFAGSAANRAASFGPKNRLAQLREAWAEPLPRREKTRIERALGDRSEAWPTSFGPCILKPARYGDERGYLFESARTENFAQAFGSPIAQSNVSVSKTGTLRGLHGQKTNPQGKLVQAIAGAFVSVAVDGRPDSPFAGTWAAVRIDAQNGLQFWIPPGFLHGLFALTDDSACLYHLTAPYAPQDEFTVRVDDPDLAIDWPLEQAFGNKAGTRGPIVSPKDQAGIAFKAWIEEARRDKLWR